MGWLERTPLNMFSSTLPNPFIAWEGEAPAEPLRRKLGRSLALPLISDGSTSRVGHRARRLLDQERLATPAQFFSKGLIIVVAWHTDQLKSVACS